ncbi:hypothetical protein H0W26_00975 [Candidatus Dependentiae bacterium]|nr:hypothetical protein [Candidatus Dependentiae bacterium]
MMLDNATYNKVKLLYKLSNLCWFLEKHAIADAAAGGDAESADALMTLKRDLQKHIERIQKGLCLLTQ